MSIRGALIAIATLAQVGLAWANPLVDTEQAPRLIVLTDIGNEPDDAESMVRLLTYTNDLQIEGLIASTSRHLPAGVHRELIEQRVAAYGQVLGNLRRHDRRYPDVDYLTARIRAGSAVYGMSGVGENRDTEASRLIIDVVDGPDPRPVWIAAWGGAADLAQALWTVRATRSTEDVERFVSKLRVYSISDQDDAGPWARAHFPNLFWVTSVHGFTRYQLATWLGISAFLPGSNSSIVSSDWLDANVRSRGALGAFYPRPAYIMEGDTPSFLFLIPNGLGVTERPDWGSWGGRYDRLSNDLGLWTTTTDQVTGADGATYSTQQATVWRWREAFQNDFAARMSWSVTPRYADANHPPSPKLNGRDGLQPVLLNACPGQPLSLSAEGAEDPDGDDLSYRWFAYREASGLFAPSVSLSSETGTVTSVTIGSTANIDQFAPPSAYQIHIILQVSDDGAPQLTRYRRAIISIPGGHAGESGACMVSPIPPHH